MAKSQAERKGEMDRDRAPFCGSSPNDTQWVGWQDRLGRNQEPGT